MPEGKDFVGGSGVLFVVDAVAELSGSFECLPVGLSRKRRIMRQTCTPRWKYLDAHVKMAFGPYKSHLRKARATLIRFLESYNTSAVCGGLQTRRDVFPPNRVIEGRAGRS